MVEQATDNLDDDIGGCDMVRPYIVWTADGTVVRESDGDKPMTEQATDKPWWHGTNYEVMDEIVDEGGDAKLQASFTPSNGIRIEIENYDMDGWASFDFTEEQAKLIGAKLIEWAERGHG